MQIVFYNAFQPQSTHPNLTNTETNRTYLIINSAYIIWNTDCPSLASVHPHLLTISGRCHTVSVLGVDRLPKKEDDCAVRHELSGRDGSVALRPVMVGRMSKSVVRYSDVVGCHVAERRYARPLGGVVWVVNVGTGGETIQCAHHLFRIGPSR